MTKVVPSLFGVLFIFIGLWPSSSLAQDRYWSKIYDIDGGNEWGGTIISCDDQLLIQVKALCEGNTRFCECLLALDTLGTMNWMFISSDSISSDYLEAIYLLEDTIFYNMSYVMPPHDSLKDYHVLFAIDKNSGEVIEEYEYYKETLIPGAHVARGITGYKDRLFLEFAVITDGSISGRHWIRAYDLYKNVLWEVSIPNTFQNPAWSDIEATPDGGLVVAYTSWQSGTGDRLGTIEKYDSTGDMEWQTNLPYLGDFDDWMRIDLHPDGGYVGFWHYDTFAININAQPNIVFKLDQGGDIEWQRVEDYYEYFELYDMFTARNGDVIACGTAHYWPWGQPQGPKYEGAFLVRYNADGERLWDRKILMDPSVNWRALYGGKELPNGDLVFTGEICDTIFGTPEDQSPCNVWVIKVDSLGCFEPDCGEFQELTSTVDDLKKDREDFFALYPNPASDYLTIGAKLGADIPQGIYSICLHDMYGNMSFSQDFDHRLLVQLDVSAYPSGLYYLTILRDGRLMQSQNVIVLR